MSALRPFTMEKQLRDVPPVGMNPGKTELFKPVLRCVVTRPFDTGHDLYIDRHRKKKLANFLKSEKRQSSKKLARNSQIRTIADSSVITAEAKPQFAWVD